MKYVLMAVLAAGIAGACVGLRKKEALAISPAQVESEAVAPNALAEASAVSAGAPAARLDVDAVIKEVAEAKLDLPPPQPGLSEKQLAAKITEIDDRIRDLHYVERGNRGELSVKELIAFRRLLALRNQYFEQKIDLMLNES